MPKKSFNKLFGNYKNTVFNFEIFHNQIINMPRPSFEEMEYISELMRSISAYILLIDYEKLNSSIHYKTIFREIFENYKLDKVPDSQYRNLKFEKTFLKKESNFDSFYKNEEGTARLFRHYMQLFHFFQFFNNDSTKRKEKKVDIEALEELVILPEDSIKDNFRNTILSLNIQNNDFISNLNGIKVVKDADYRPAYAILKYIFEIKRPVTLYEVSILFGRVGDIQIEREIIDYALKISQIMPKTKEEQKDFLFTNMGWENNGVQFEYKSSQNPDFKFKTFVLLMDSVGLIKFNKSTSTITLTKYSKEIMEEDIPFEILDLQNLISKIEDTMEDDNIIWDILLKKRTPTITKAIQQDGELVYKMNLRNIKLPKFKNGKRVRNKIITEIAKIKADYTDEVSGGITFEDKKGRNYVEAHHIIEFNNENGPDITENLICLGPENHQLIHRGSTRAVRDFYHTTQTRGIITFERFKNICTKYRCLTQEHVDILLAKGLISKSDSIELNKLIEIHGIDDVFLKTIS